MRLRDLFRRPAPSADSAPEPAVRPAVAPAWPDLPPLQRVVSAPSLVTAPDGFRQGLVTWGNPSFVGTPGHLVTPDAPSGSVAGLTRPAVRWDAPPALGSSGSAPAEEPADDGPSAEFATEPATETADEPAEVQRATALPVPVPVQRVPVQRAVTEPLPLRRLPAAPEIPSPRAADLVSAAAAPVPEPVWRPTVPEPAPSVPVQRAETPHFETQHLEGPHVETPSVEAPLAQESIVESSPVEAAHAEAPPEAVVPVPSRTPLPVQTLLEVRAAPADPLPAPRRRLGLGAPLPTGDLPAATAPTGASPLVARLLEAGSAAASVRGEEAGTPVVARLAADSPPAGRSPRSDSTTSPAVPEPVPAPARTSLPDSPREPATESTPAPPAADEPAMTVVQRHAGHDHGGSEEAPLLGAVPLGLPLTDDIPVQRTYGPGAAPQGVPAVPSALPTPAGQSTSFQESGLPGGPAVRESTPADVAPSVPEPIIEPIGDAPAAEVFAPLAGERPLVARMPQAPDLPGEQSVEAAREVLPAPVAQRQPYSVPIPAQLASVVTSPAAGKAGLVGERLIAQRMNDPAPEPQQTAESPSAVADLSTPTTAVRPLGERPIVLRALGPTPGPMPGPLPGQPAVPSPVQSANGSSAPDPRPVQRLTERALPPMASAAPHMPTSVPAMPAPRALPSADRIEPIEAIESAPATTEPPAETVTVSRLASPESEAATAAPAAAPAAEMHAGAPAGHGGAPAHASVDAEVHRLFDPLTRQFKAELRLDRERVGHALDLRY